MISAFFGSKITICHFSLAVKKSGRKENGRTEFAQYKLSLVH